MDFQSSMTRLEMSGTEQNRKVFRRHGVKGELYGVSFADLDKLAKEIKKDKAVARNPLALELWDSGVHDARLLAVRIADSKTLAESLIDVWVQELDNYIITDAFSGLVGQTPYALSKAEAWKNAPNEWISAAGWNLMGLSAMQNLELPDNFFVTLLNEIESDIHTRENRTRYSMNSTLIAIGIRNPQLETPALAVAEKIGEVNVDHGQTNCETPFAPDYIRKTWAYKAQRAAKKKG